MRPNRPWKRNSQEPAARAIASSAVRRSARRATSNAVATRLPTAQAAENEPETGEAEAEMGDGPGDEEVERCAAAVVRHVVDDAAERVPADEERERLVLVRRPGHQLHHEERRDGRGHSGHAEREPARGERVSKRWRGD